MKWHTDSPVVVTPRPQTHISGAVTLSISPPRTEARHWQHCLLSFGQFSDNTMEQCQASWPREALNEARRALDEFEATLDEETK